MSIKTVVVLIPCYNGASCIEACLDSVLAAAKHSTAAVFVYVIDNNSNDDSVSIIERYVPRARVVQSTVNLGFAGGHNLGWRIIQDEVPDCDYLYLLNQDTVVDKNFLDPLIDECEKDASIGAAQSMLVYAQDTERINSLGNVIHYLGFGYSSYNGIRFQDAPHAVRQIHYSSGAAVLLRASLLHRIGLFDGFMFMYLEDLDLGWRILFSNQRSVIVPSSVVYHAYEFSRSMKQYYYFERNRWWILLKNYRLRTLLVLSPALFFMECAQVVRATIQGRLILKLSTYAYFFSYSSLKKLLADRRRMQSMRRVSDHKLIALFSGVIEFQPLESFLLTRIANPLFALYHKVAQSIIKW